MTRVNRCKEILQKAINDESRLGKFVGDATRLTEKLLELCNKTVHAFYFRIINVYMFCLLRLSNDLK